MFIDQKKVGGGGGWSGIRGKKKTKIAGVGKNIDRNLTIFHNTQALNGKQR